MMNRRLLFCLVCALAAMGCDSDDGTPVMTPAGFPAPPPGGAATPPPTPVTPPAAAAAAPPPVVTPPAAAAAAPPPVTPPAAAAAAPPPVVTPPPVATEPTFTRVFEEIVIGTGCNGGPFCHGGPTGGLTMVDKDATYDALINVVAMGMSSDPAQGNCVDTGLVRVVPGDPGNSLLMQKLDGVQTCGQMMPTGGLLEESERALVRDWIMAGALNN